MKDPVLGSDPSYNKRWPRRESHNCYSYLLNLKSPEAERLCMVEFKDLNFCRRSQPGYAAGYGFLEKEELNCPEVMKRTLADNPNIKPSSFQQTCDIDSYKGSLVVDPGQDWTHKAGYKPSSAYDASGILIFNPEKANRNYGRLNYSDFCGYFCVPRKSTKKRMYHKPLNKKYPDTRTLSKTMTRVTRNQNRQRGLIKTKNIQTHVPCQKP